MSLICFLVGVYWSLRTWNPATALGWIPVDGHAYEGDCRVETVTCSRCGALA
jgi:hypothetical protein